MITGLTGRPVLGVLPWAPGLWLDAEDSLALDHPRPAAGPPYGGDVLRVSVVRVPRISNFTDIDALAAEPGVLVRMASTPAELADADLVVLPGSRATVADLAWLRERGFERALAERARAGRPLLGICGGYQQLATRITDEVESGAGTVAGLGLLPVTVEFAAGKTLARPELPANAGLLTGYEIHHAITTVTGDDAEPFLDGCRVGAVWGTSWHGALENDEFRLPHGGGGVGRP
jgi:adenosylcobyric acid synthase